MQLSIGYALAEAFFKCGGENKELRDYIGSTKKERDRFPRDCTIDAETFDAGQLEILIQAYESNPLEFLRDSTDRKEFRLVKSIHRLRSGKSKRITNLKIMASELYNFLKPLKRHWLFQEKQGQILPYFVKRVWFTEAETRRDNYIPAQVHVGMVYKFRGVEKGRTESFEKSLMQGGCTPETILERLDLMPENDDLIEKYEEELEKYQDYTAMAYEQFLAGGGGVTGYDDESNEDDSYGFRWHREGSLLDLEKNGGCSKVVMDDGVQFGEKGKDEVVYVDQSYWKKKINIERADNFSDEDDGEVEDTEDGKIPADCLAPVHCYCVVFSLAFHEFVAVHVNNLKPYEYDKTLTEKLVLSKDHRKLIDVLMATKYQRAEDIVRGKRGGVVVLCSGHPGTGKTLTAEVYSEIAERPLYTVQCSQLGVNSKDLEERLAVVLRRAQRWNAILLIDEADVYIHERGSDVNQNAIVGVFLRLLEYFSGVMFLTTNRATVVDDAIHSRCIAHVRYTVPDEVSREKIWRILSAQYGLKLSDALVDSLVSTFPTISGRSIKQLCRLSQTMEEEPTLKQFAWLATYQEGIEIKKEK